MDQRDAFWQVPQVSNIVVQKIILRKEEKNKETSEKFLVIEPARMKNC